MWHFIIISISLLNYMYNSKINVKTFSYNVLVTALRTCLGGGRVVRWCWVNFQCRDVLLVWIIVWQGPTAIAVGAGGGYSDIFSPVCHSSLLSPAFWETAWYRLKYCLKGPLSPKQPTNQTTNMPIFKFINFLTSDVWLFSPFSPVFITMFPLSSRKKNLWHEFVRVLMERRAVIARTCPDQILTLKAPIMTAADDIHNYFFIVFSEKIRLDVSSESSARQRIHMKKSSLVFFER